MRIALFQMNVRWGDVQANMQSLHTWIKEHFLETDLLVLPEMFTTGFCVDSSTLAETEDGPTLKQLQEWSRSYHIAITGSLMIHENGTNYNRAFFLTPEDEPVYYDKRHLFQMGSEGRYFTKGEKRVIVSYLGWNILLQICYDLRFPVFSRVRNNDYDLAIYMACWPTARIGAWKTLLPARAIENEVYVCGVNAVGVDSEGRRQGGNSMLLDMKGQSLLSLSDTEENSAIIDIQIDDLHLFREKFPAWKDADDFECL